MAVTLGAGGISISNATIGSGERTSFVPITPCRLIDTRASTPLGGDETRTVSATGAPVGGCTITNQATGLALNVTAVNPTQPTFLTLYPTGTAWPGTSNLNPAPGQPPTPNAVTVDLNGSGQFNVYNFTGSVDVIVDVVGYYEDHHHDDRYYTEAEVDAKAPKASFAMNTANSALGASYVEVARLGAASMGGTITLSVPARVLLTGAVTINENGGTGQDSQSRCKFQWSQDGGGYFDVGRQQFAEAEGNSNHDETVAIALTTGFDAPAGTHDVRIVCAAALFSGLPAIEAAELTALAVP